MINSCESIVIEEYETNGKLGFGTVICGDRYNYSIEAEETAKGDRVFVVRPRAHTLDGSVHYYVPEAICIELCGGIDPYLDILVAGADRYLNNNDKPLTLSVRAKHNTPFYARALERGFAVVREDLEYVYMNCTYYPSHDNKK